MSSNAFSAADSALGYLYQVRVALLWSLRRAKVGGDFVVSLETLDDVTFESKGGTPEDCSRQSITVTAKPPSRTPVATCGRHCVYGLRATPISTFLQARRCACSRQARRRRTARRGSCVKKIAMWCRRCRSLSRLRRARKPSQRPRV